jgi:hypothetical protein
LLKKGKGKEKSTNNNKKKGAGNFVLGLFSDNGINLAKVGLKMK